MYKNYKPPFYKPRALELQWMNNTVQGHDMICSCDNPWEHLATILTKTSNQKCLGPPGCDTDTADHGTQTDTEEKDILEQGDLDKLFEEDFTEEDSG